MKIAVIGAVGRSGQRLVRLAVAGGHEVTAFARDRHRLAELFAMTAGPRLKCVVGDATDRSALAAAMTGCDVVINAAGNAAKPAGYVDLVTGVIETAQAELGRGGRFWFYGGAAALDIPGTSLMTLDLPNIPVSFEAHRDTFLCAKNTMLDWSMLCIGPMIAAEDGEPRLGLRLSAEQWPVDPPSRLVRAMPQMALSWTFRRRLPEMIVSYEDAASVIIANLSSNDIFSRKRVGVALPRGMCGAKNI